MNNNTLPSDQKHPVNPNYAWLEQTRQRLLQMTGSPDADILQDIIDEGLSRLESLSAGDPLLAGCMHLSVAEAQLNLALSQENQAQRLAGLAEGRRSCEKATELTLTSTCGTACLLLRTRHHSADCPL